MRWSNQINLNMKAFLISILLLSLSPGLVSANMPSISADLSDRDKSYVISRMVNAYMHDYIEQEGVNGELEQAHKTYQRQLLSESNASLNQIKQFIINSAWKNKSVIPIIDTLYKQLNNELLPLEQKLDYPFVNTDPKRWNAEKQFFISTLKVESNRRSKKQDIQPQVIRTKSSSGNWMLSVILVLMILSFVFILILFVRMTNKLNYLKDRIRKRRADNSSGRDINFNQRADSKGENFTQQNQESLNKLHQKIDEIIQLIDKIDQRKEPFPDDHSQIESDQEIQDEAHPAPAQFVEKYYSMPNSDKNVFIQEENMPERINYKLIVDEDAGYGEFEVYFGRESNKSIVLNQPDQFVKPACRIKNGQINNPTGIKMVSPGKVEKREEGWKITQKAEIEFV